VLLADLIRFYKHPARALIKDRAALSYWSDDAEPDEQIPAELSGLDRWAVGERLLRLHLAGADLTDLCAAEWRRGTVPPRNFGQRALEALADDVAEVAKLARPFMTGPVDRREIVADLGESRLTGTVPGLYGDHLVRVTFSSLSAKHRLPAWLELLALSATHPDRPWRAVTVGRRGQSVLGPIEGGWAAKVLADLVELRQTGLAEPIPFAVKTSAEYARIRFDNRAVAPVKKLLIREWDRERDETHERFFGTGVTLDDLMAAESVASEERGDLREPSRFCTLARRVFHPLLMVEESP